MVANGDQIAQQMLAMAEYFRQRYEIRRAIKCSLGASKVAQSDCFKILTVHQTGKLYHLYTHESEQAEKFLKLAYHQMSSTAMVEGTQQTMYDVMREYRLEAACMLAEHHLTEGLPSEVAVFTKDLADARILPHLYTRLAFLCAEGAMGERNSQNALRILDELRFVLDQRQETKVLATYAMISRLHVQAHLLQEVPQKELENIARTVEAVPDEMTRLNMQIYYMCVQLANFADTGMVRTSKGLMKTMQQLAQVKTLNRGFRWGDPTYITALVCVFTQTSMFQNCNRERAIKYYNHACRSIKDYSERSRTLESGVANSVRRLKMLADETMCQTKMINCELTSACETLHEMLSDMNTHPALQVMGVPRAHLLLGILALYLENSDQAEKQFNAAVATNMPWDAHFSQLLACHRGLLYLQNARQAEFYDLDDEIGVSKLNTGGTLHMRAILKFIHALHAYLNNKVNDCRVRVHEILDVTKSEDMFRMYTYALLLFTVLNDQAKLQMISGDNVTPTIEWANKSSDVALLAWTYMQLIQINDSVGADTQKEQDILYGHLKTLETSQTEMRGHRYKVMLDWTSDSLEPLFPRNALLP
ncbi:mau-2 [Pristionchus pacificus]|uniref:Cohesin loading complex subunit SCC4 homolog n=1 Tax=Pristionchus pacificus TaxID=54126 RepID=A0A2A6BKS2_PRIPA|nr:mau-2 [Pristionchus pacificus]|eukprot:PDM66416.1 mau-2 [Pristionchus pacificus]